MTGGAGRAGRGVAYAANVTLDAARLPSATFAAIWAAFVEFGPAAAPIVTLTAIRRMSGRPGTKTQICYSHT